MVDTDPAGARQCLDEQSAGGPDPTCKRIVDLVLEIGEHTRGIGEFDTRFEVFRYGLAELQGHESGTSTGGTYSVLVEWRLSDAQESGRWEDIPARLMVFRAFSQERRSSASVPTYSEGLGTGQTWRNLLSRRRELEHESHCKLAEVQSSATRGDFGLAIGSRRMQLDARACAMLGQGLREFEVLWRGTGE